MLHARGWTEAMIQRVLGEPDQRIVHHRDRTATPMRLYRAARVIATEATPVLAERSAQPVVRSARGKAIVPSTAQAPRQHVVKRPGTVWAGAPAEWRQQRAVADDTQHQRRRAGPDFTKGLCDGEPATLNAALQFLARIAVTFVRHHLMWDDHRLEEVAGQDELARAIAAIRHRIFAASTEAYPYRAQSCARRLAACGQTAAMREASPAQGI